LGKNAAKSIMLRILENALRPTSSRVFSLKAFIQPSFPHCAAIALLNPLGGHVATDSCKCPHTNPTSQRCCHPVWQQVPVTSQRSRGRLRRAVVSAWGQWWATTAWEVVSTWSEKGGAPVRLIASPAPGTRSRLESVHNTPPRAIMIQMCDR